MGKIKSCCMPCSEDEWRLKDDVRTLARAEAIKKDPDYYKKVKTCARKMLDEQKRSRDESQAIIDMAGEK